MTKIENVDEKEIETYMRYALKAIWKNDKKADFDTPTITQVDFFESGGEPLTFTKLSHESYLTDNGWGMYYLSSDHNHWGCEGSFWSVRFFDLDLSEQPVEVCSVTYVHHGTLGLHRIIRLGPADTDIKDVGSFRNACEFAAMYVAKVVQAVEPKFGL